MDDIRACHKFHRLIQVGTREQIFYSNNFIWSNFWPTWPYGINSGIKIKRLGVKKSIIALTKGTFSGINRLDRSVWPFRTYHGPTLIPDFIKISYGFVGSHAHTKGCCCECFDSKIGSKMLRIDRFTIQATNFLCK